MIKIAKLTFLYTLFIVCSFNAAFASQVAFDTEYFQDIGRIILSVSVTSKPDNTAVWHRYDQSAISSPLSREEIEEAVLENFKSQFSGYGIEVVMDGKVNDQDDEKGIDNTDPFAPKLVPSKKSVDVNIFVVIKRYEKSDTQFIYGAISSKIVKNVGKRFKSASDLVEEALPQPFILPNNKEEAKEVIKEKTNDVFKMQRRWMLCKEDSDIKCYDDSLDNWKEQ